MRCGGSNSYCTVEETRPYTRHKSLLVGRKAKALPTDGRTDGRTNDRTSDLIESLWSD